MRSFSQAGSYSEHVDRQERAAEVSATISFDNLLKTPITVDGLDLDSSVSVVVRRDGGVYEINYIDIRSVHIVAGYLWGLVEIEAFAQRHPTLYKQFCAKVEAEAIRQAKGVADHEWTYEDEAA